MKGLILAGGHGTRLRPLTFTGNKHMLPIANKPMLYYGLEHLRDAGIKDVGIVLGPIREGVVDEVGDGSKLNLNVTYIHQGEPKGLAHAVLVSEDFVREDPFVMYLGDNLLKQGVTPLTQLFKDKSSDCVIGVAKVRDPRRYGVVEMMDGRVVRLVEKPKEPKSDLALIGIYVFNQTIFDAVKKIKPSWRDELEITDAIQLLVDSGRRVNAQFVDGWWKDTGNPEDLIEANQLILSDLEAFNEGIVEPEAKITGRVGVGKGTTIHKGTLIRGPVIIGPNCEIGPNVYIGPYTSIGDDVKMTRGEVENSIVMDNCIIDCSEKIVDSLIGKNSKIRSDDNSLPRGLKLVAGDNTLITV